jgi:hypothetical protein
MDQMNKNKLQLQLQLQREMQCIMGNGKCIAIWVLRICVALWVYRATAATHVSVSDIIAPLIVKYNFHNLNTRQKNNLYLPQANLTIHKKGTYYSEITIFNNLPLEIKNVAGNQKNKIVFKKCYTLIHFTQWKSTLVNRELSTVSQDLYYSGILI